MDTEENKEIAHQKELLKKYKQNLQLLELQEAHFGILRTPPHILIEIQDLTKKIHTCEQRISELKAEQKQRAEAIQREAKRQSLLQALDHVKLVEDPKISLMTRLENAQMIGSHDKRIGVCTLPESSDDQYWCEPFLTGRYPVAGGKVVAQLYEFRVARYPVTVWQFRQFVSDHGYSNKRWWNKESPQTHEYVEFLPWNIPGMYADNQPIVSVSWYEATAFCRWLSDRARSLKWLSDDYEIRLPTEAEWTVAAMWDTKLNQMSTWCPPVKKYWQNVQEVNINTPSPVGIFPEGASPCGALDMAGNVWEWCSSSRNAYPMQAHIIIKNIKPSSRDFVLRGGSWKEAERFSGWNARSVASLPTTRLNNRGFRIFLCTRSVT